MPTLTTALANLGELDALASRRTPIHDLDPRAKVLTAFAFMITVVSFGKYNLSGLLPFFIYPVALIALANLPPRALLVRLALAAPFALCVGLFNPVLDRAPLIHLGSWALSGGWVSFASIMLRFLLTLSAALILIATTGMTAVCAALARLRVPRAFTVQLLLLYRYLYVLLDDGTRVLRAHALRSTRGGGIPPRIFASLVGQLLLRSLDRAQRLHVAMLCRGFDGEFHLSRPLRARPADVLFTLGWIAFFILARSCDLPNLLGRAVLGGVMTR